MKCHVNWGLYGVNRESIRRGEIKFETAIKKFSKKTSWRKIVLQCRKSLRKIRLLLHCVKHQQLAGEVLCCFVLFFEQLAVHDVEQKTSEASFTMLKTLKLFIISWQCMQFHCLIYVNNWRFGGIQPFNRFTCEYHMVNVSKVVILSDGVLESIFELKKKATRM